MARHAPTKLQMASTRAEIHLPKSTSAWIIGSLSLLVVLVVAVLLLAPPGLLFQAAPLDQAAVAWLPTLNAGLNSATTFLLTAAYLFIRRQQVKRHRFCMLLAFGLSALFLASYVIYHVVAGSTRFTGPGWARPFYFTILFSHIALATLVLPLGLTTLYRAWRGVFAQHRRIARWTLPLWLYVSASGVVIYLLLYHW